MCQGRFNFFGFTLLVLSLCLLFIPMSDALGKNNKNNENKGKGGFDENRTINGEDNNLSNPLLNSIFTKIARLVDSDYSDGISSLAGDDRPNPRDISNSVVAQNGVSIPNEFGTSDFLWQWGQFLDHDIDLTEGAIPVMPADISVPAGDPFFDPFNTGTQFIPFNRSIFDPSTGTDVNNPRQQENEITGWIDASNVYGSDQARADSLKADDFDISGKLKVTPSSVGDLLPFDVDGLFLAGDVRASEQVGLTSMHTLFVREHNRLADEIADDDSDLTGEEIYQKARKIVGAQMQVITYNEFLPALLGKKALSKYRGYDPDVDSTIFNVFSTAAYRFGHSALSPTLLRLDSEGNEIPEGNLSLLDAFFDPSKITDEGGIEPILRGLASQLHQKIDSMIVDDVRNFLFGPPGAGGFDLASLNIQRGRDHGLPSYNDVREQLGLGTVSDFDEISSDPNVQANLASIYDDVDDIDIWVGGLAEDPLKKSHLGETFSTIISLQFEVLRDGDRFWYERHLSKKLAKEVEKTTLSDIIKRNTDIGNELQKDAFFVKNNNKNKK